MSDTLQEYHVWIAGSGQSGPKIYGSIQEAAADNKDETAAIQVKKRVTTEEIVENWNMGTAVPATRLSGTFADQGQTGTYRVFTPTKG